jgi:plastocyanin
MPRRNRNRAAKKSNPSIPRMVGQGGYYTEKVVPFLRKVIPDGSFARGGAALGNGLGRNLGQALMPGSGVILGNAGSKAGRSLGAGISRILGFGDYTVANNSLLKMGGALVPGEEVPSFGFMGEATKVRHREYLQDIVVPSSPTVFTNTSFSVNPGNAAAFPWLASIAHNYQQYKFNGLIFEFKTLSSDITAGGALGAVIMASNYDVVESQYSDKISMENSQYAVSAKPSCSQIHTMECLPSATANNLYYVRGGAATTSSGQDNRFFDLANFQIATSGLPGSAGAVLGELWVSYDVSLYKPIINAALPGASVRNGGTTTNAAIFGATPLVFGSTVTASGSTLTFTQPGQYMVHCYAGGTGLTGPTLGGTVTSTAVASSFSGSTTLTCQSIKVLVATAGRTLIMDYSGSTAVTLSQTIVTPCTYSLTI